MVAKTYRAEDTMAFNRPDPSAPPQVIVKGNLYEFDLADIPKQIHPFLTAMEPATPVKKTTRKTTKKPAADE